MEIIENEQYTNNESARSDFDGNNKSAIASNEEKKLLGLIAEIIVEIINREMNGGNRIYQKE